MPIKLDSQMIRSSGKICRLICEEPAGTIKAFRKTARVSAAELAKQMDWNLAKVNNVETGRRAVTLGELADIAAILDVDVRVMLDDILEATL